MATTSKELKQLQTIVCAILESEAIYRDDDKKLCCRIWATQLGGIERTKQITAYNFFTTYVANDTYLYSQDTITRARRLLQEKHPELRGLKWKERQKEQDSVKEIIQELKN